MSATTLKDQFLELWHNYINSSTYLKIFHLRVSSTITIYAVILSRDRINHKIGSSKLIPYSLLSF